VIAGDTLRPPGPWDPARTAYKDWLHVILFDHEADAAGLVNVSIHGPPADPETQVVTTALVDVAGQAWVGNVVTTTWSDASIALSGVATASGGVTLLGGDVLAAAAADGLRVDVLAQPVTQAFAVEVPQRFGAGWIAWRVVPRLLATGAVAHPRLDPSSARPAYHDHNWGRWRWGDDIGWEWGSFLGPDNGSVVVARTTDQAHRHGGSWTVIVDHAGSRRTFSGRRVEAWWSGRAPWPSRRLPGALAAQHSDRRRPRLPGSLRIVARAGRDAVELDFSCRSVAQLILADPMAPGVSFLHEMSGRFQATGRLGGRPIYLDGLAMVERLE
jgi:hypothetical protein